MPNKLHLTDLHEDEKIIFGPVKQVRDSALGVKDEDDPHTVSHKSLRTVCVTNQRIIIENGDSHIHFPNIDIRHIIINRSKAKKNQAASINLIKAMTNSGNTIKLHIPDVQIENETLLGETFPNAAINEEKGLTKLLGKLVGE